ncbi:FKBP-type peptidyl-prolyl cis-trans isomerase [Novosphingobium sp. FSW06-99]|uniref:FKBP-type peptidyl-prolyl cis-trans isomerase n=1 Tax=Novosphingobium sp. FSW06-99 TaxID=1739113 RepID=UPI00076D838A|nr:FKBP-type peptidyl-prolyl cis-trans isomerase [Novosphingobium sp. FSW06-99]KUR74914.1 peptidylprolyl isomerase [Novosphingobium sp. FSW06-99]
MTEITRVPLQPIAKGAIGKLWLGVVLAVALGGAVAFETRQKGLEVVTVKAGSGATPGLSDVVEVNYVGYLANGKEFDRGEHAGIPVEGVIPGFSKALQQMQKGGKYHVVIPARLAYGAKGVTNPQTGEVSIPGNADLTFDIELLDYKSAAELMRERAMIQRLQQQMQGAGSAPGGAAGGTVPQ